jgi:hypothetical protein
MYIYRYIYTHGQAANGKKQWHTEEEEEEDTIAARIAPADFTLSISMNQKPCKVDPFSAS